MICPRKIPIAALAVATVFSASCSWIPKVKVPFISSGESAPRVEDPAVPYDFRKPLNYGHTLEVSVYRGLNSPSRIFSGGVMVDEKGLVHFKDSGDVKVGGLNTVAALRVIDAHFHKRYVGQIIHVQLSRIETVELVTATGAVKNPTVVPWSQNLTASALLSYAGPRTKSDARAIYVIRKGARVFHASPEGVKLEAGDVIDFSGDL